MSCSSSGENGVKYGPSGHCYTGADARARAGRQAAAEHTHGSHQEAGEDPTAGGPRPEVAGRAVEGEKTVQALRAHLDRRLREVTLDYLDRGYTRAFLLDHPQLLLAAVLGEGARG